MMLLLEASMVGSPAAVATKAAVRAIVLIHGELRFIGGSLGPELQAPRVTAAATRACALASHRDRKSGASARRPRAAAPPRTTSMPAIRAPGPAHRPDACSSTPGPATATASAPPPGRR